MALAGAVAGVVNAYFDLMTTIPGAFALTAVGATLGFWASDRRDRSTPAWRVTAAALGGWVAGLVWMWVGKWVLAAVVLGYDEVADNVGEQVRFRLSGENRDVDPSRWRGFADNLSAWWEQPLTVWVVLGVMAILAIGVARSRPQRTMIASWAACSAVVLLPVILWHLVLNNHSQIHAWLVYRSLPFAFGGVAALTWVALVRQPERSGPGAELAETEDRVRQRSR